MICSPTSELIVVKSPRSKLLRGILCHVNVIPLNPTSGYGGSPTPKAGVDEFIRILGEHGIPCTPRTRRGIEIDGSSLL